MPIVRVQVPHGAFDADTTEQLISLVNEAAAAAERMPADPAFRTGLIVLWETLPAGAIRSNGDDPTSFATPVFLWFHPPAGVVDDAHATEFVAAVQQAFEQHGPPDRLMLTSVAILPVAEGHWGIGGKINRLPDFAARAGYAHLQHLVGA